MNLTQRDITILGSFAALLVVGMVVWVKHQTAVPETASQPHHTAAVAMKQHVAGTAAASYAPDHEINSQELQVVAKRDLFKPLVTAAPEKKATPVAPKLPQPPLFPFGMRSRMRSFTPPEVTDVAVTGTLESGGRPQVLIEHPATKETQVIGVGETAFGYTLTDIDPQQGYAVLTRGSDTFRVQFGDNKVETRGTAPTSTPSSGNPSPPTPSTPATTTPTPSQPSFNWSELRARWQNMSPEEREQMRRQRRGGG